jgi:hypothetical protein
MEPPEVGGVRVLRHHEWGQFKASLSHRTQSSQQISALPEGRGDPFRDFGHSFFGRTQRLQPPGCQRSAVRALFVR